MDAKNIGELFGIRTQSHYLHLLTTSYAEHKALGGFYPEWLTLTDSLIETYFGKYGRVDGSFMNFIQGSSVSCEDMLNAALLNVLAIETDTRKEDSDLLNILADMKQLINHTRYLLTLK